MDILTSPEMITRILDASITEASVEAKNKKPSSKNQRNENGDFVEKTIELFGQHLGLDVTINKANIQNLLPHPPEAYPDQPSCDVDVLIGKPGSGAALCAVQCKSSFREREIETLHRYKEKVKTEYILPLTWTGIEDKTDIRIAESLPDNKSGSLPWNLELEQESSKLEARKATPNGIILSKLWDAHRTYDIAMLLLAHCDPGRRDPENQNSVRNIPSQYEKPYLFPSYYLLSKEEKSWATRRVVSMLTDKHSSIVSFDPLEKYPRVDSRKAQKEALRILSSCTNEEIAARLALLTALSPHSVTKSIVSTISEVLPENFDCLVHFISFVDVLCEHPGDPESTLLNVCSYLQNPLCPSRLEWGTRVLQPHEGFNSSQLRHLLRVFNGVVRDRFNQENTVSTEMCKDFHQVFADNYGDSSGLTLSKVHCVIAALVNIATIGEHDRVREQCQLVSCLPPVWWQVGAAVVGCRIHPRKVNDRLCDDDFA